jgi:hypothetical protein
MKANVILCTIFAFSFIFTGCGKDENNTENLTTDVETS